MPIAAARAHLDAHYLTGFDIDPSGSWLMTGDQVSFPRLSLSGGCHSNPSLTSIERIFIIFRYFLSRLLGYNHASRPHPNLFDLYWSVEYFLLTRSVEAYSRFTRSTDPIGACFLKPRSASTSQIVTCSGTRKFPLRSKSSAQRQRQLTTEETGSEDSETSDEEENEVGVLNEEDGKDSLQVFEIS
jgi:hypothetical protein